MSLKKVKKQVKRLTSEGSLYGFDFDDLNITRKAVRAEGSNDEADFDMLIKFNKHAKIKSWIASYDFYKIKGRTIQSFSFSNYKRYTKAIESSKYENRYANSQSALNSGNFQKAVDLLERMPGVSGVQMELMMFDGSPSGFWT